MYGKAPHLPLHFIVNLKLPIICLKSIQGTTAEAHLHCNSAPFGYMMTEVSACIHKNGDRKLIHKSQMLETIYISTDNNKLCLMCRGTPHSSENEQVTAITSNVETSCRHTVEQNQTDTEESTSYNSMCITSKSRLN